MGEVASLYMSCHGEYNPSSSLPVIGILCICSDNCQIGLYCDTNTTVCIQQRAIGANCDADKECLTYNCLPNRVFGISPSNPRHFPTWVYIVIGTGIFGGK